MSLKERITEDFTRAFKEKDSAKKETLSMIRSEIKNREIELGKKEVGLGDEEIMEVLARAIKQRRDSAEQFQKGGREELAGKEQQEIDILREYLPKQIGDEEIESEVKQAIEECRSQGECSLGRVMGLAMGKMKGKADGSRVREIAARLFETKSGEE